MIRIKEFLDEQRLDGLLFIGDSLCDLDMYYLSGFLANDRFTLLVKDTLSLLVSSMELGRAKSESKANVMSTSHYGIMERLKSLKKPNEAYQKVLEDFLRDNNVKRLGVPFRFPAGIYQQLSKDFEISIVESPVPRWRAIKTEREIDAIRSAQRSCDEAMRMAVELISKAEPRGDRIYLRGQPLTSEHLRGIIEVALREDECEAVDTIVAGGKQSADPHARGSGPLPANEPIVIDIFPRSNRSRYFADMTRTVVRGEASLQVQEVYRAVLEAQMIGLSAIRAGVSGQEVHAKVCQVFRDNGYPEREGKGFTHSTGHGVGLNIHEKPSLSEVGEVLEANNVVAIEPGLYYPDIGGVRLEDLVVVTEKGCENLTKFEKKLII